MSPLDDHVDDMGLQPILDDDAIEAFFAGRPDPGWHKFDALVALDRDVARAVAGDPPPVGPALARLMRPAEAAVPAVAVRPSPPEESSPQFEPHVVHRFPHRPRRRVLVGLASGVLVAAGALPVAAATHVLPQPAERVVARVVEAVTPFEIPERAAEVPFVPVPPASTAPQGGPQASETRARDVQGMGPGSPSGTAPVFLPPPVSVPSSGAPSSPGTSGAPPVNGPASEVVGQTPAATIVPPVTGPPAGVGPGTSGSGGPGAGRAGQTPAVTAAPPAAGGPPSVRGVGR